MSSPSQESTRTRTARYPMEVFNDHTSTSASVSHMSRPNDQEVLQRVPTPVDVQMDPDPDDFASSDADSWLSAESNLDDFDDHSQIPQTLELWQLQAIEDDHGLYNEQAAEVATAMSRLSMDTMARPLEPAYDDVTMSTVETERDEANDLNPDSSFSAATDASGSTANITESEGSQNLPRTPSVALPRSGGVWDDTISSRAQPSGMDLSASQCSKIAHSDKHVRWFDEYGVPWCAQWQIGVLISKGSLQWEQITEEKIQALSGTNAVAGPKVPSVLFPKTRRRTPGLLTQGRNPYTELDREEDALNKGTLETLGLCRSSEGADELVIGDWWGGRVEQRAVMVKLDPKSMCSGAPSSQKIRWSIRLHQQEMRGKSCRFTRKFGSRRFIQLKIPDRELKTQTERDSLHEALLKPYLLHGRVFRAFSSHDGTVRLVETNENVGRVASRELGDSRRLSFLDFLDWFNPLEQNAHQIISKWSARFALGLSTSQPVLLFERPNIHFIDDIISLSHDPRTGSPASKHVMTDGCGRMNRAALRSIQKQKELSSMPTAVQGRIAGAKGLWILDDKDQTEVPRIWITRSQVKIQYTPEDLDNDPSRRIFDLLRLGRVTTSVRLSAQPITNFAHNGVPHDVFSQLLQESLAEMIDHLLEEWKSDDRVAMWDMVFKKGGVSHMRKSRYAKIFERVFGNFRDTEETDESSWASEVFGSPTELDAASSSGPDPNSGWPSELAEQIIELFQAGFIPSKCTHLASLMKTYLKKEVRHMVEGCHIPIKRAAEAFAAPDFSRILKPGEVFFRSSQQCGLVDDPIMADGIARGDMIIFRYPIRTPSDGRLVKAVDYPELRNFTDVLLFSTHGERSGASILAGGDYDGDTIHMITEPRLVETFKNSSLKFADPPQGFDEYLEKVAWRGHDVLEAMSSLNEAEQVRELQMILMDPATREKYYGRYSTMTDIATYIYGYSSERTHYLSYMFSNELDSEKSGVHVKRGAWDKDWRELGKWNQPACMRKPGEEGWKKEPQRLGHLEPFVLDALNPFAREQEKRYLDIIDKLDADSDEDFDPALVAPVEDAERRADRFGDIGQGGMRQELEQLKTFVKKNRGKWARLFTEKVNRPSQPNNRVSRSKSFASQNTNPPDTEDFFSLPRKTQTQKKREIADAFWNDFKNLDRLMYFNEAEARRVMGSYAYLHAYELSRAAVAQGRRKGSLEYAFLVAFKILAELKATEHGQYSISVEPFHDFMVPRRYVRDEGHTELD